MEHNFLELYIQIRDGQPHEHPIFGENFKEAFPDIDVNNLPADRFAKFIRVAQPQVDFYEVYEGVTYEWADGIVKDMHHTRPMTEEERVNRTAELEAEAKKIQSARITILNIALESETDELGRSLLLDCITAHEDWVLQSVAPMVPDFPPFPYKDENGNWVAPAS